MSEIPSDRADGVATITLNRPDKRNALAPQMLTGSCTALAEACGGRPSLLTDLTLRMTAEPDFTGFLSAKARPPLIITAHCQQHNPLAGL